jgi:glutamyl-tRNA reductase
LINASCSRNWPNECREIDILASSTAAQKLLLTPKILGPMIPERLERPLFIIDAAVDEMDGVFLYDIDALQLIAEQSLALRRLQIAPADAIIAEHVADFARAMLARGCSWRAQPKSCAPFSSARCARALRQLIAPKPFRPGACRRADGNASFGARPEANDRDIALRRT